MNESLNLVRSWPIKEYCNGDFHAYPKTYAGNPEYAKEYFSHCLCGKKKKVITVKEVDT